MLSQDIIAAVKDIQHNIPLIKDHSKLRETMSEKYPELAEKYVALFDMALKPNMDMQSLEYMLQSRDKVLNGEETVRAMSEEIGWKFWNKYQKK